VFIREKPNASGTTSVQIIKKTKGRNTVVRSCGTGRTREEIDALIRRAEVILKEELELQSSFNFTTASSYDQTISDYISSSDKPTVICTGPELVLGKVFDSIGFNKIPEPLFKDLVITRLVYPVSKLKTVNYLELYKQQRIDVSKLYRFLDRFYLHHQDVVEELVYQHTKRVVGGDISIVFYDMTTLYFEAEDEDDLRKIGFSKDGKFQHPQIMLGLVVTHNAYPIGYDIFEGNTFEGKTLIPVLESIQKKYSLPKPIVVADSGLLSKENIAALKKQHYQFIIGARIKNESHVVRNTILSQAITLKDGQCIAIEKELGQDAASRESLIIGYSTKRAKKDAGNRNKAIAKLQSSIKSGKLTKRHLSSRGYNKFLAFGSDVEVLVDQEKIKEDALWDGLKGYVTNTAFKSPDEVIKNYQHLWQIERAFRISKTDLRVRPIFHRKRERIEAHLCIAFAAYAVFKELERLLQQQKLLDISAAKAIELTKTIFQLNYTLPDSKKQVLVFASLTDLQKILLKL
jgi:transposase